MHRETDRGHTLRRRFASLSLAAVAALVATAARSGTDTRDVAVDLAGWAQRPANSPYDLPPRPGTAVGRAFFGQHLHALLPEHPGGPRTTWPDTAVGLLRLWDSGVAWFDIEPARGRWRFDRMDAYVAAAKQAGARVIYPLGPTPRWASARPDEPCPYGPGCAAEPRDLADWERYVRQVAQRYHGRIAYYEAWNEPHPRPAPPRPGAADEPGFYSGNWATLVELARRARAVLREVDPAARLLTPGFDGDPARVAQFLALGGAGLVDGVAFHYYGDDDRHIAPLTRELRATMARHGLQDRPLLNTESSYSPLDTQSGAAATEARAVALTTRAMVLGAFAGVDAWVHHAWDNRRSGMVTEQGRPRPLATSYRTVQGWLDGLEPLGCRQSTASVVACLGRRGKVSDVASVAHTMILWSPGMARTVQLPAGWAAARIEAIDGSVIDGNGARQIGVDERPVLVQLVRVESAAR